MPLIATNVIICSQLPVLFMERRHLDGDVDAKKTNCFDFLTTAK